jgi:hypothetical protein
MPQVHLWTEEQAKALEVMRRELQRVNQEQEAMLEEQKEALLRCQHDIQSLHELTSRLQASIEDLSISTASSGSGSCRVTTAVGSDHDPVQASRTVQRRIKRQPATPEPTLFEKALHFQVPVPLPELSERTASSFCQFPGPIGGQSHAISSHEPYLYESLTNSNNIRLLELESGPIFAPLQCKLVISGSFHEHSYQALSYAWGETTKTHHVVIEGKRLPISANLDRALRRIRQTEQDLCLWVDAICINQDDAIEKEAQISIMLQIYRSARRVIVYLGEQSDHSELMPQFFDTTIRMRRVFDNLDDSDSVDPDDLHRSVCTMKEIGDPTSNHIMWRAVRAFYGRPWMLRVWVVQEVLAADELVFLCGGWELPGSIIYDSVAASIRSSRLFPFDNLMRRSGGSEEEGFLQMFRLMNARSVNLAGREDLLDLLYLSYGCKATDPRDRVFALLGLAQDAAHPLLSPDYCEDWRATYQRYTEYFFREFGLRALYLSSSDTTSANKQSGDLPSWVTDFSFERKRIWLADEHNQVHGEATAGGHEPPSFEINTVDGILTIQVLLLDTVQLLSPGQADHHISDPYTQVVQWRIELETLLLTGTTCSIAEAQEMICAVMLCKQDPPDIESLQHLIWAANAAEFEEVDDRNKLFGELLIGCEHRRRCIISNRGFIGQVPLHAQVGDVIVIPIGSAVPFVVRPCQARYRLVGQAFIHGVMMGEALQCEGLDEKLKEIELV